MESPLQRTDRSLTLALLALSWLPARVGWTLVMRGFERSSQAGTANAADAIAEEASRVRQEDAAIGRLAHLRLVPSVTAGI
jgi:hypothetical protein